MMVVVVMVSFFMRRNCDGPSGHGDSDGDGDKGGDRGDGGEDL